MITLLSVCHDNLSRDQAEINFKYLLLLKYGKYQACKSTLSKDINI